MGSHGQSRLLVCAISNACMFFGCSGMHEVCATISHNSFHCRLVRYQSKSMEITSVSNDTGLTNLTSRSHSSGMFLFGCTKYQLLVASIASPKFQPPVMLKKVYPCLWGKSWSSLVGPPRVRPKRPNVAQVGVRCISPFGPTTIARCGAVPNPTPAGAPIGSSEPQVFGADVQPGREQRNRGTLAVGR